MRGLATIFFGRELPPEEVSTVLVVCSADALRCPQILSSVHERFVNARMTYIVPSEYLRFLPKDANKCLISDLKRSTLRTSREISSQKYDVTVLMLTGQPIFRKAKLWALFTNFRMLVIYNENLDAFSCSAANRVALLRHLKWRLREKGLPSLGAGLSAILLFPLGLIYLLFFTSRALLRRRIHIGKNRRDESQHEFSIQGPAAD